MLMHWTTACLLLRKMSQKKNSKKLTTVTPSVNKILQYFPSKHEDNPDVKTTTVKDAIDNYEGRYTEGNNKVNTEDGDDVIGRFSKKFEIETKKTFSAITPKKNMVQKR